jgi:hypothetical protein
MSIKRIYPKDLSLFDFLSINIDVVEVSGTGKTKWKY